MTGATRDDATEVTGGAPAYGPDVALVVVDVQNDFAEPTGGLYVAGGKDVLATVNHEVEQARAAGATVVYTQDWHPESTPHFAKDGGVWPVHCVAGTWGAELHRDLLVDGDVVRKGTAGEDGYSGFSVRDPVSGKETGTRLDSLLAGAGVKRLVVVGLAGDYCVKETALDGRRRGYDVTVPLRATRFVNLQAGDDQRAARALRQAGITVTE